jgi:GNAT superfamily N-acetyltransferase
VAAIGFRPLAVDDMQAMFLWLLRPHVAKWYAPAPSSFAEVVAKYGPRTLPGDPVGAWMVTVGGREAGYIQSYAIDDFPDYAGRLAVEPGTAGIDLFIGEEELLGWGLGARVIRRFVDEIVFPGAALACIAGPPEGHRAAIRAFEKAGFAPWKAVANERGELECVMRLDKRVPRYRLAPIDLGRDASTCVAFRREMYVASFGSQEGLEEEMGQADALYLGQLRERIAEMPEANVHLWDGDRIIGQAEMRLRPEEPAIGYVNLFYLVPECRGQGLGAMLHEHAARVSRDRGLRGMRLSVSARNVAAIGFYRGLGWTPIGPRPHRQAVELMEYALEAREAGPAGRL